MTSFLATLALLTSPAAAQESPSSPVDLDAVCAQAPAAPGGAAKLLDTPEGTLAFLDMGFCRAFTDSRREMPRSVWSRPVPAFAELSAASGGETPPSRPLPRWKVRLYASHSFTTYFPSDITFHSSRYDLEVKDYEWAERGSREFFKPSTWQKPGNNPLQVLDEPSNTFVVSIEKDGNEFFLSAFHPKFLQAKDQVKYMKGTIDGTPVDGVAPVNKPFDGYDQVPGESEIVRNENTHLQMAFEVGYGRRFKLFDSRIGSISYVPGVAAGVMVGQNFSSVIQEGQWWEFDGHGDSYGVQGFGGSLTNRVELNAPRERVGLFYENKLSMYKLEHGFLDGTQKYDLKFMGNSVGVKFMLYDQGRKKKKKPVDAWAASGL